MDSQRLGEFCARVMEQLQVEWAEDCCINDVAIVLDVHKPATDSTTIVACTDERSWVKRAFLEEALDTLEVVREAIRDEDDDG